MSQMLICIAFNIIYVSCSSLTRLTEFIKATVRGVSRQNVMLFFVLVQPTRDNLI